MKWYFPFILVVVLAITAGCGLNSFLAQGNGNTAAGDVLFQDDFSNTNSGWDTWSSTESVISYHEGGLRITVMETMYDYWSLAGRSFNNTVITTTARTLGGPEDNNYGILCRYVDSLNFYALLISSDGYAGIVKVKEGEYEVLNGDAMTYFDAIQTGQATNQMEASCVGNSLRLIVNGQTLVEAEDEDYTQGDVGLLAGTFEEGGVDILFDDFVVKMGGK